jgi:hypothetical protein
VTKRILDGFACKESAAVNTQGTTFLLQSRGEGVVLSQILFAQADGIHEQTVSGVFQIAKLRRSIEWKFFFFRGGDAKDDQFMPLVAGNLYRLCRISLTFRFSRSDKEERRRSIAANAHDL